MRTFTVPASLHADAKRVSPTHDSEGGRITDQQLAVLILNSKLQGGQEGGARFMRLFDQGRITVRKASSGDYEVTVPMSVL